MDTRKCPECGVENEVSRATCIVCHARMTPKKVKGSPNPLEDKNDLPQIPPEPILSKPKEKKVRKGRIESVVKDKEPEVKIKRRARRKSKIPEPETFLVLRDGKLQAVNVKLTVRAIKPKEVSGVEQTLIFMWNRNKDLFTD